MTRLVSLGALLTLVVAVGCDANKAGTNNPDGAQDDPGSRMEAREGDVATAAPVVEGEQGKAEQKVQPSVQDRDPEEEKRKMAKSRKQSAAARNLLGKGRLDQAITASREALRIHEQNVDAMLIIAEAYFKQSKWEITLAVCSSALAVDAKIRSPQETSQIHNLRAFAYDRMGEPNLATESFREAAQSDEKNAAAWNNLGTRYLAAGDTKTALGCFEYALELDPKFAKAHVNYGAALRANGQVAEAEKEFIKGLQLQPNYGAAYFNLGVLYLDADPFPGLDTTQRLNKSIEFLGKYKQFAGAKAVAGGRKVSKTKGNADPVTRERADDYIRLAQKGLKSEARRKKRAAERGAKAAASDSGVTDATGGATDAGADSGAGADAGGAEPAGGDAQPGAGTPTEPSKPTQPAKPTPVQPGKPTPVQPGKPTPTQPAPAQPSKPTPSKPSKPAPVQPSKPAPSQPAPAQPKPAQPKPAQPKPTQPAPTQPKPVQPKPVQPTPVKPTPVKPVQPK